MRDKLITATMLLCFGLFLVSCSRVVDEATTPSDTTAPTVTSYSPTGESIPLNTKVTATFSETMDASSIITSTFTLASAEGNVTGTISYDASSRTATFTPAANLTSTTTYTATVSTGVKDAAGNGLAAAQSWSFRTGQTAYSGAPSVATPSPANGSVNVAVNVTIEAVFNRLMDSSTINASTFTLKKVSDNSSVEGTITLSSASGASTASFTPNAALANGTTYEATLTTSVKDVAGNALSSDYTWRFTTVASGSQADTTAPTITSVSPASGETGVANTREVRVVFSEAMNPTTISTVDVTITATTGAIATATVTYDATTRTAIFTPTANLHPGVGYVVTIGENVNDLAGNRMSSSYQWNFTTVAFTLSSSAFSAGQEIPTQYCTNENGTVPGAQNQSPPLSWTNIPPGTQSFVLEVLDTSANSFIHWMVINIPATTTSLSANASQGGGMPAGSSQLLNDFSAPGDQRERYDGPAPPSGTHFYQFFIYALNSSSISVNITIADSHQDKLNKFNTALSGKVLAYDSRLVAWRNAQ